MSAAKKGVQAHKGQGEIVDPGASWREFFAW